MSGRRLMSCTSCHRKHYAPTGAWCPYKLGEPIPADQLPDEDRSSQERELSDSEILTEDELEAQRSPTPPYNGSEFELQSAQSEPVPSTSTAQPPNPITLQQFADTTSGRVKQLEEERTKMMQTQELLLSQQRSLEQQLAAFTQQWPPQGLQPNRDVRQKTPVARQDTALPNSQSTEHLSRATTPHVMMSQTESQLQPTLSFPRTNYGPNHIEQDGANQYEDVQAIRTQAALPQPMIARPNQGQSCCYKLNYM